MLTIRLQRAGKKNRPEYRLVLAEKTAASQKKFVEVLGSYNPHSKALAVKNEERLNYWIGQHAEISPTVHNLLVTKQILTDKKVKSFTVPKKEVPAEVAPAETAAESTEAPAAEATEPVAEETAAPEAPAEVPTETPAEVPAEESPTPETPVEPRAEVPTEPQA